MKLAVGVLIAHGFPIAEAFFDSYEQVMDYTRSGQANVGLPKPLQVTEITRIKSTSFPVDYARNDIVRGFLKSDADWLFFMDADQTFPKDVVRQLLRHNVPFVSGRYHMRKAPFHAVAYVKHRTMDGPHCYAPVHYGRGLFEIERGGAGCLMVHRCVYEAIRERIGENWFRYQRGPEPPHDYSVSEDFQFYRAARESGFTTYLDWDCECGHLQTLLIARPWNQQYLDAQAAELSTLSPERREQIVNSLVACGYPDGYELPTGDRIPPYLVTAGER